MVFKKNKKKQRLTKREKVTAKKTGSVVVYAKYKKKQYKCKVTVKAPVKVANMKENNAIFTRNVYQKDKQNSETCGEAGGHLAKGNL